MDAVVSLYRILFTSHPHSQPRSVSSRPCNIFVCSRLALLCNLKFNSFLLDEAETVYPSKSSGQLRLKSGDHLRLKPPPLPQPSGGHLLKLKPAPTFSPKKPGGLGRAFKSWSKEVTKLKPASKVLLSTKNADKAEEIKEEKEEEKEENKDSKVWFQGRERHVLVAPAPYKVTGIEPLTYLWDTNKTRGI